jgi:hypothetical protein
VAEPRVEETHATAMARTTAITWSPASTVRHRGALSAYAPRLIR